MRKYFIGITGISTAGKSTLGMALLSPAFSNSILPVPHATYRQARPDDDSRLIKVVEKSVYDMAEFVTIDGNYGTMMSDYKSFVHAENAIGLSIVSCNEMGDLKTKLEKDSIVPVFVALTLTETPEEEKAVLSQRIPSFFEKDEHAWRLQFNTELVEGVFFNPSWLKNNSVTRLSQKTGSVLEWIKIISKSLPATVYDEGHLASEIKKIMDRQTFSRKNTHPVTR